MDILFLGTGGASGSPEWACDCETCKIAKKQGGKNERLRPSVMITSGNKKIVIDMGPDFRIQMLKNNISHLDHVFITHDHADHIASILELKKAGSVTLHIPKYIYNEYFRNRHERGLKLMQIRNPKLKLDIFDSEVSIGKLKIGTIKCKHAKKGIDMVFPCCGYLFTENKFKFAYLADFDEILDKDKVHDIDLFVCDGAVMEPKWGHVGIKGGIKLYKKIKPKKMIFTHIGHFGFTHEELEKYVKKFGNIGIAYDGMKIKV